MLHDSSHALTIAENGPVACISTNINRYGLLLTHRRTAEQHSRFLQRSICCRGHGYYDKLGRCVTLIVRVLLRCMNDE